MTIRARFIVSIKNGFQIFLDYKVMLEILASVYGQCEDSHIERLHELQSDTRLHGNTITAIPDRCPLLHLIVLTRRGVLKIKITSIGH